MDAEGFETIGHRVRRARRFRGLTQTQLADLADLSQGFISRIESGDLQLERRSDIIAIANALDLSPTDITGQPFLPADREHGLARAALPDVRRALMSTDLDYTDRDPSGPIEQIARNALRATHMRVHDRAWEDLGRLLPDLLLDTHAAVQRSDDPETALESVVLTGINTATWCKALGFVDLAWIAADRAYRAACMRNDPLWIAAARFYLSTCLLALGSPAEAARTAVRAISESHTEQPEQLEVHGMLHLVSALSLTTAGESGADAAIAEAADMADAIEQAPDPFGLMFSPANVRLWQMQVALESGDPERAAEIGRDVEPREITITERRAGYHKDLGLALARIRLDAEAVAQLRQAERLDPHRMRNHPIVREAIAGLLMRQRREAGGRELRGMAHRMGVVPT